MRSVEVSDVDLASWCERWLGTTPTDVLFRAGYLSKVTGLRLADGRDVVVKVRPGGQRLYTCTAVQRWLWSSGFPCPRPLAGPQPLGPYAASAESYQPGGDLLAPGPGVAVAYARLLAELVRTAPPAGQVATLAPAPAWVHWDHPGRQLWPRPDDRDGDLNVALPPQSPAAEEARWLDAVGALVRRRLAELSRPGWVIGRGDYEAQNLRWRDGRPLVVHDWDSLIRASEAAVVGFAAAGWPAGTPDGERWRHSATLAESEEFLAGYQEATGRRLRPEELAGTWAAGMWMRTFNARKCTLDGTVGLLDRAEAAERLARAGVALTV